MFYVVTILTSETELYLISKFKDGWSYMVAYMNIVVLYEHCDWAVKTIANHVLQEVPASLIHVLS